MESLRRKLWEIAPAEAKTQPEKKPSLVYLSSDAVWALRAVHQSVATLGKAPVHAAAEEARRYKLWHVEFGGRLAEVEALDTRLRQLTRADRERKAGEDEFIGMVRSSDTAESSVESALRAENAASFVEFKRRLCATFDRHDYDDSSRPSPPRRTQPAAITTKLQPPALSSSSGTVTTTWTWTPPPLALPRNGARPWEVRRENESAYYEERFRKLKEKIEEQRRLEEEAHRRFDALRSARRVLEALTDEENARVTAALRARETEVLLEAFNIEITGDHTRRLRPRTWLVDELINFYFELLAQRDRKVIAELKGQNDDLRPSHFFNSYFYVKLLGDRHDRYNYAGVKRWTKRFDIFQKRFVCVPVNVGNMHWTLIVIDVPNKTIRYFDSMAGSGDLYLKSTLQYLKDEHQDKKKTPLPDPDAWTLVPTTRNTPQQDNGYDCGVFATFCAHFVSLDGTEPDFHQDNIIHLRRRMMLSILDQDIPV